MPVNIEEFSKEVFCQYKGERYSVRDNGAALRHSREGKRHRKEDNIWTWGKEDPKRYLKIGTEFIHRIVATAFHGPAPTSQHVVDHIDTNRMNNRPENLRWLTKVENLLKNPITVSRIIYRCGSIEAFLENPSLLADNNNSGSDWSWMRTVTPQEARAAYHRMMEWSKKENRKLQNNGVLGEWLFAQDFESFQQEIPELFESLTPGAVQDWKTPSEFPCCPQGSFLNPISTYLENLKKAEVFSRNMYSILEIIDYAISRDENTLWVISKAREEDAIKQWYLARITFEDGLYVHTNLGSFFEQIGAEKRFTLAQGLEWTGPDSIDDNS
jgi:hypothetical protein